MDPRTISSAIAFLRQRLLDLEREAPRTESARQCLREAIQEVEQDIARLEHEAA